VGGSDAWRKVLTGPAVEEAIGRRKLLHRLSAGDSPSPEGRSASLKPQAQGRTAGRTPVCR